MKVEQKRFSRQKGWETLNDFLFDAASCNLVLVFGCRYLLEEDWIYPHIRQNYPNADVIINSTGGEIYNTEVDDETISLTAIQFAKTTLQSASLQISGADSSRLAGNQLALKLDKTNLRNVLVIADGHNVNGSELIEGLTEQLPNGVIITGGLAGDGYRFEKTLVGLNGKPDEGLIVLIGFYGDHLNVSYGCAGGWSSYGPERLISKSDKNILYELDGKPALDIYKKYLGEYADELPAAGLFYPLSFKSVESGELIIRTILNINEAERSLTFAGNIPEGSYARMMMANFDKLIEGASNAAQDSISGKFYKPQLALLISCVGRKKILHQRIEEEIEVIRNVYGSGTAITGFYSYGEISPSTNYLNCELHNETMTITTFSENE